MRILSTDYYSISSFSPYEGGDPRRMFALVCFDIGTTNGREPQPVEDFRFNQLIDYRGIGNSFLMRVNACAALHLSLWCLKPHEECSQKIVQYFAHVVLSPIAAIADAVLNVGLLIPKIALITAIALKVISEKLVHPTQPSRSFDALGYAMRNGACHLEAIVSSNLHLAYQAVAAVSVNWLGPHYDLSMRLGSYFNWAYFVHNDNQNAPELILDVNRVNYICSQCGWEDVPLETFKNLCPPWDSKSLNYSATIDGNNISYQFSATYIVYR